MLLASLVLAAVATPQEEHVYRVDEVSLTIDLSDLKLVKEQAVDEQYEGARSWKAKFGKHRIELSVWLYANRQDRLETPEDLLDLVEWNFERNAKKADRTQTKRADTGFDSTYYTPGEYGYIPYAMLGEKLMGGEKAHHYICMAGLARRQSYLIEIETRKPLDEEAMAAMLDFLRDNVRYDGEVQVRTWKDEEIEERWKKDGPEGQEKKLEFYRTEHFVILTNSSGKKKFAKELEKSYKLIRAAFPFEERKELRLLPIFLFRTPQNYYDFCVKSIGWTEKQAKASKGVAYRDFYATWYEAPKDPVHIHEVTHQLFRNRLHLSGGGSWFQEGVAEFMCSSSTELKEFKRLAKKKRHVKLREFFTVRSLLGSNSGRRKDGSSASHEAYTQAGCIIEFVHEAKAYKGKFQEFVHAMGAVPRSNLERIEEALRGVYGVSIEKFEEDFLKYWVKR